MRNNIKDINHWNTESEKTAFTTTYTGNIDSLNVSCTENVLKLFSSKKQNYTIEILKRKKTGHLDDAKHKQYFGKSMVNSFVDKNGKQRNFIPFIDIWAVLSRKNESILRMVRPVANEKIYKLEFAGLQQYDQQAENLTYVLQSLWADLQENKLNRIDVAIDFSGQLPKEIEQIILTTRKKQVYENTVYYRTEKQKKKRNTYVNILAYDKTKKDKHLAEHGQITRLEFSFSSSYLKKYQLSDFEDAKKAMVKYIKKKAGIKIEIPDLSPKKSSFILLELELLKLQLKYIFQTQMMIYQKKINDLLHLTLQMEQLRRQNACVKYTLDKKVITLEQNRIQSRTDKIVREMENYKILFDSIHFTIQNLTEEQNKIKNKISDRQVEWVGLAELAKEKNLGKDAIRKQLQNGDFEEGVDFKSDGNKIIVHQGAIGRIQRKRRSSNG